MEDKRVITLQVSYEVGHHGETPWLIKGEIHHNSNNKGETKIKEVQQEAQIEDKNNLMIEK